LESSPAGEKKLSAIDNYFTYQHSLVKNVELAFHKKKPDFRFQMFLGPFKGLKLFLWPPKSDNNAQQPEETEIKNAPAPYTYILPLGLAFFWVLVFIFFFFWHHNRPYWVFCFFAPLLLIFTPYLRNLFCIVVKMMKKIPCFH